MDPRLLVAQLEEFREALEGINANVSPPPNPRLGPRVALPSLLPRPVFSNRVADRPPRARPLFPPRSVQQLQRAEDEFAKHAAEDAKERDAFSATRDRELRDAVASVEAASVALDADAEAGHARLVEHLDRLREDFTRSAAKGAAALLAHAGEISALSDAHAEFVKRVEAETAYQRVASAWPAEAARDFVEDAEAPGTGTANDLDEGGGHEAIATRYSYPCRCGDRYELDAEDLHVDFDFVDVPCASCSLFTRVRYGPADE